MEVQMIFLQAQRFWRWLVYPNTNKHLRIVWYWSKKCYIVKEDPTAMHLVNFYTCYVLSREGYFQRSLIKQTVWHSEGSVHSKTQACSNYCVTCNVKRIALFWSERSVRPLSLTYIILQHEQTFTCSWPQLVTSCLFLSENVCIPAKRVHWGNV